MYYDFGVPDSFYQYTSYGVSKSVMVCKVWSSMESDVGSPLTEYIVDNWFPPHRVVPWYGVLREKGLPKYGVRSTQVDK